MPAGCPESPALNPGLNQPQAMSLKDAHAFCQYVLASPQGLLLAFWVRLLYHVPESRLKSNHDLICLGERSEGSNLRLVSLKWCRFPWLFALAGRIWWEQRDVSVLSLPQKEAACEPDRHVGLSLQQQRSQGIPRREDITTWERCFPGYLSATLITSLKTDLCVELIIILKY